MDEKTAKRDQPVRPLVSGRVLRMDHAGASAFPHMGQRAVGVHRSVRRPHQHRHAGPRHRRESEGREDDTQVAEEARAIQLSRGSGPHSMGHPR